MTHFQLETVNTSINNLPQVTSLQDMTLYIYQCVIDYTQLTGVPHKFQHKIPGFFQEFFQFSRVISEKKVGGSLDFSLERV